MDNLHTAIHELNGELPKLCTNLAQEDESDIDEHFDLFWQEKERAMRTTQNSTTTFKSTRSPIKGWDTTRGIFFEDGNEPKASPLQARKSYDIELWTA